MIEYGQLDSIVNVFKNLHADHTLYTVEQRSRSGCCMETVTLWNAGGNDSQTNWHDLLSLLSVPGTLYLVDCICSSRHFTDAPATCNYTCCYLYRHFPASQTCTSRHSQTCPCYFILLFPITCTWHFRCYRRALPAIFHVFSSYYILLFPVVLYMFILVILHLYFLLFQTCNSSNLCMVFP